MARMCVSLACLLMTVCMTNPSRGAVQPIDPANLGADPAVYFTVIPQPQQERYELEFHAVRSVAIVTGDKSIDARLVTDLTAHLRDAIGIVPSTVASRDMAKDADLIVIARVAVAEGHPQPNHAEGYKLVIGRDGAQMVATIDGHSVVGVSHGVQSLKQLLLRQGDRVVIRSATLVDWPWTPHRFVKRASQYWMDMARRYRMNGATLATALTDQGELATTKPSLEQLVTAADQRMLGILAMVNMGNVYRGDSEFESRTLNAFTLLAKTRVSHVALMNDDRMTFLDARAQQRFGTYAAAQLHYLTQIAAVLNQGDFKPALGFMPNFYYGRQMEPSYAAQITGRLPENVALFWAGPATPGSDLTVPHLQHVREQIRAGRLWFYTNWPQVGNPYYAENFGPIRDHDFGDPNLTDLVTVSTSTMPEVFPTSYITMCDLLWNPRGYEPRRALMRATKEVVDPDSYDAFLALFDYLGNLAPIAAISEFAPMYGSEDPQQRRSIIEKRSARIDQLVAACRITPAAKRTDVAKLLDQLAGKTDVYLQRLARDEELAKSPANRRQVNCPLVTEAPTLDGRLDDPAWTAAATSTGFTDLRGNAPAPHQTQFRVMRTRDTIYLAVECDEPFISDPAFMDAGQKYPLPVQAEPAAFLWWADGIEIFLDPGQDARHVYQIIVNPWGLKECFSYTSLKFGYYGRADFRRENWPVRGMITKTSSSYVMELAIPMALFGDEASAPVWGFNIGRNRHIRLGNGMKYSTWTPLGWGFQDAQSFGILRMDGNP